MQPRKCSSFVPDGSRSRNIMQMYCLHRTSVIYVAFYQIAYIGHTYMSDMAHVELLSVRHIWLTWRWMFYKEWHKIIFKICYWNFYSLIFFVIRIRHCMSASRSIYAGLGKYDFVLKNFFNTLTTATIFRKFAKKLQVDLFIWISTR